MNVTLRALTSYHMPAGGLIYHWSSAGRRGPSVGQEGGWWGVGGGRGKEIRKEEIVDGGK